MPVTAAEVRLEELSRRESEAFWRAIQAGLQRAPWDDAHPPGWVGPDSR